MIQKSVTQEVIQTATAALIVLRETDKGSTLGTSTANAGEVTDLGWWTSFKATIFDWKAPAVFVELLSFEMEVAIIPQIRTYDINDEQKVPITKMARKGEMQLIQTFTSSDKEACITAEGLFTMLGEKFKAQHNETILML